MQVGHVLHDLSLRCVVSQVQGQAGSEMYGRRGEPSVVSHRPITDGAEMRKNGQGYALNGDWRALQFVSDTVTAGETAHLPAGEIGR